MYQILGVTFWVVVALVQYIGLDIFFSRKPEATHHSKYWNREKDHVAVSGGVVTDFNSYFVMLIVDRQF